MTVELPADLASSVVAAVQSGRFGSAEELIAQAIRSLLSPPATPDGPKRDPRLGSIGSMREDADELEAIVAEIHRGREQETLRSTDLE